MGWGSLVSGYLLCLNGRNKILSSIAQYGEYSERQCIWASQNRREDLNAVIIEKSRKVKVIEMQVTLIHYMNKLHCNSQSTTTTKEIFEFSNLVASKPPEFAAM